MLVGVASIILKSKKESKKLLYKGWRFWTFLDSTPIYINIHGITHSTRIIHQRIGNTTGQPKSLAKLSTTGKDPRSSPELKSPTNKLFSLNRKLTKKYRAYEDRKNKLIRNTRIR